MGMGNPSGGMGGPMGGMGPMGPSNMMQGYQGWGSTPQSGYPGIFLYFITILTLYYFFFVNDNR